MALSSATTVEGARVGLPLRMLQVGVGEPHAAAARYYRATNQQAIHVRATMGDFEHWRHKPPTPLALRRELVVACAPMRSNVNLSRIVRMAGCSGVPLVVCCGAAKIIDKIARDSLDEGDAPGVEVRVHRTLAPALRELKEQGFRLVGLEQATGAACIYDFRFPRRTVLVVGNERHGLDDEVLRLLDDVVEIPVYGRPLSYNAATAATMGMYEYCRQFPTG